MSYEDYPWYFQINGVLDAWDITKGDGVVVDLIDSCVNFSLPQLAGRNKGDFESKIEQENMSEIDKIHGTAMASIIVSAHEKLPRLEYETEHLNVAGISPHSFIRNSQHRIDYSAIREVIDKFKSSSPSASNGAPVLFDESERPQILLINLSGGQISTDTFVRTKWSDIISQVCKNNDNILFISSVGNSKVNLDQSDIIKDGILPASLNPKLCKKEGIDPLIRTGATGTSNEELYETALRTGSNYGKKYVDILAPGQAIPVLSEVEGYGRIVSGTSESAAISLIVKCKPLSSAKEIKDIILSSADNKEELEYAVDKGRVVNILNAVKKACFQSDNAIETKSVESDGSVANDCEYQKILTEPEEEKEIDRPSTCYSLFANFLSFIIPSFILVVLFKLGVRCPHPGIPEREY